jgi:hemerythrin
LKQEKQSEGPVHMTQWSSSLVLGVDAVDEDHERLVSILNNCYRALMLNNHDHELAGIVNELRDYTCYHFETERKLMVQHGYSEAASHIAAHKEFIASIQDFKNRFLAGESFVALDVLTYLNEWLVTHINKDDREFVSFLKAKENAAKR